MADKNNAFIESPRELGAVLYEMATLFSFMDKSLQPASFFMLKHCESSPVQDPFVHGFLLFSLHFGVIYDDAREGV